MSLPVTEPSSFRAGGVIPTLHKFATNKKSGYERESAAIAFQALATTLGAPTGPILLPSLPVLYELYMDKGDVVRQAATAATKAILKLFPPESTHLVFRTLESILEEGKWRTKVAALDAIRSFVSSAGDAVANELGTTLPKVEAAMHDTKSEVSTCSVKKKQIYLSPPDIAGFIRCNQMRHGAVHDPCKCGSCTPHSFPRQMHVGPHLGPCLYQITFQ